MGERRVLGDPNEVARAAAEWVADAAADAVSARGGFRIGLSGGRTPEETYRLLATARFRHRVDWNRIRVLFADERDAPPTEPESNYWMVRKLLLEPAGILPDRVHRMKADGPDLEAAARSYEPLLEEPLDLLLLGIGEDGHTASLFPGSALLRERSRRVAAVHHSPKPPPRRLTVTPRVLEEARDVLVLATGSGKADAVRKTFSEGDVIECPARLVRDRHWILDRGAAARLA